MTAERESPSASRPYDELEVMARLAIDAWMLHAIDLDRALGQLRAYIKGDPEAVALAREMLAREAE